MFRFFEHPVLFTRLQVYEGRYVIQTEEQDLSAVDAVRRAHIYVAALALLIHRAMEKGAQGRASISPPLKP